jgi:hypothetical protein
LPCVGHRTANTIIVSILCNATKNMPGLGPKPAPGEGLSENNLFGRFFLFPPPVERLAR